MSRGFGEIILGDVKKINCWQPLKTARRNMQESRFKRKNATSKNLGKKAQKAEVFIPYKG